MTEERTQFVEDFIEAAKENDQEKMAEMANSVSDTEIKDRVDLLEQLVNKMKETKANDEVAAGLAATLELLKYALEAEETAAGEDGKIEKDSTSEEAKDEESKAEGSSEKSEEVATQDVAADTSADEDDGEPENGSGGKIIGESGGYAPATEEEEEKDDSK